MKKILSLILALLLCSAFLCACAGAKADIPYETAVYDKDTELGNGAKTLTVKVTDVKDVTVTFTIHTDKATVGEALLEHKLIAGDDGQYGMYVKRVNGTLADYDKDKTYWQFTKDGEYMMSGVDLTEFADGDTYELTYTK